MQSYKSITGFTLLELALALCILSLLGGWLFAPLTAQRDAQLRQHTWQQLQEAKQALIGHALIMHYLPCPDTDAVPDGWENVGANQSCDKDEGILPWRQLALSPADAWGRYWRYRVDSTFSHHGHWFSLADAENASNIQVATDSGEATSTGSRPVAIILSHGKNGLGGVQFVTSGSVAAMAAPVSADEKENADADTSFVDKAQAQGANAFDDMLVMLSPKVLLAQMVEAQRLP